MSAAAAVALSFDEAVRFLEDKLSISNVAAKAKDDRLLLLKEYTKRMPQLVPFQNLSLLVLDPEERCIPTHEVIVRDVCSRVGGLCYSMGCFSRLLLSALKYDSYLVACSIPHTGKSFTHVAAVAENVAEPGDCFLIETGFGFPTFEPVSLKQLPVQYKDSFLEYKFVAEGDVICRYHRAGEHLGKLPTTQLDPEGWQKFYEFQLIPRSEEFLEPYQYPVYTDPGYAARWYLQGLKMTLFPECKAITLNNYVLKTWDEKSKHLVTTELQSDEDLIEAIKKFFPMMKGLDIRKAIETMKREQKKANGEAKTEATRR